MLHGVINDTAFRNGYRKFIARWWVYHIIVVLFLDRPLPVVHSLIERPPRRRSNDSPARSFARPRRDPIETIIDAFYSELSVGFMVMPAVECHEFSAGYYSSRFFIGSGYISARIGDASRRHGESSSYQAMELVD